MILATEQSGKAAEIDDTVMPVAGTKEYADMRDRAAYIYITGAHPTHLRSRMRALLRMQTSYSRKPVSLDGRTGSVKLAEENVERLQLQNHPMVMKVREHISNGYKIELSTGWKDRRPYSKILLFKAQIDGAVDRLTIQEDGSVKDGWHNLG